MAFIKDIYRDEIRDGWLVTVGKKKVWNCWLELWQEVNRICRKHDIKCWAYAGTLLGAARHGGFIPWDEDMDLCMFRPDFNHFCDVVEAEFDGGIFEIRRKTFSSIQICNAQTTLLGARDLIDKTGSKGLMIEIFPLDVAPDGTSSGFFAANAINELFGTVYNFPAILNHVQGGRLTVNDWSVIETLHNFRTLEEKYKFLSIYAAGVFDYSFAVIWAENFARDKNSLSYQKEWFRETIYLPFETVELPAPVDYDKVLTACYGDWRTPVHDKIDRLGVIYSADIPYKKFLELIDMEKIFGTD